MRKGRVAETMNMFDVVAPVLMIIAAVAGVAVLYLGVTALKDRRARKNDERDGL